MTTKTPDQHVATLDPLAPVAAGTLVTWEINGDEGLSPAAAAARVWQQTFGRGPFQPSSEEACVFTISDGDRSVEIDLSDERFAHLFEN